MTASTSDDFRAIADDIRRVRDSLRVTKLSRTEYVRHGGKYSLYQIYDGGETWESHCQRAGVPTKAKEAVPDDIYFENLKRAVAALKGRLPRATEKKKFGLNFSKNRWANLNVFFADARRRGILPPAPAAAIATEQAGNVRTAIPDALPSNHLVRAVPPIPVSIRSNKQKWQRSGVIGFPYVPQNEQGVVAMFAILCSKGKLPWEITDINGGKGLDATLYDHETHRELRVELKWVLTEYSFQHRLDDIDMIVCWESKWTKCPVRVFSLKEELKRGCP
jgi:hypothetical protein